MAEQALIHPRAARPAALWLALWRELAHGDRRRLKAAGVAMLVGGALTALLPVVVGVLVDRALGVGERVTLAAALEPLSVLAAFVVISQLLEVLRHQLVHSVTTSFERDMRERTYRHLMRLDLDQFRHGKIGSIYGRANRSIEGAERLIKLGAMDLLPTVTVALLGLIVAFTRDAMLGAVMALVVPTGFAIVWWQVRSQAGIRIEVRDVKEEIDGDVSAWLQLLDVIRTAGAESYFGERITHQTQKLRRKEMKHHIAMSLFDAAKAANEGFWLIATLVCALKFGPGDSAGEITGLVLLFFTITRPLRELHRVVDEAAESAQQADDLITMITTPEDASYRATTPAGMRGPRPAVTAPAVCVRGLTFRHRGAHAPVLENLDLDVRHGERVGVVGSSGCGKSTLLQILARLHHGAEGTIELEGRDLLSIPRRELVTRIGYVAQDARLFRGTVAENLRMGRASVRDADIVRACRRANIHDEILRMPSGYETLVGERGDTLSGGQRQRLCLARALVRTPPLMLLDEPTSALDGPSQATVQGAIDSLDDVTLMIVAHRLTTLRTMDRILVLGDGAVVEEGSYDLLAARQGPFARMLAEQNRKAA